MGLADLSFPPLPKTQQSRCYLRAIRGLPTGCQAVRQFLSRIMRRCRGFPSANAREHHSDFPPYLKHTALGYAMQKFHAESEIRCKFSTDICRCRGFPSANAREHHSDFPPYLKHTALGYAMQKFHAESEIRCKCSTDMRRHGFAPLLSYAAHCHAKMRSLDEDADSFRFDDCVDR